MNYNEQQDLGTEVQKVKDINQKPSPIYYSEQVDQLIVTPDTRSNLISRKIPRIVKVPIYALDEKGEKVPLTDEKDNIIINAEGEVQYIIKDYKEVQKGWRAELDVTPTPEIFSIDNATSNISGKAVAFVTRTLWFFNFLSVYQDMTKHDYSVYLHKLRNDGTTVLQASKSYNGGILQILKTFINKTDSRQWLQKEEEEQKKTNPLAFLTGGSKKKKPVSNKPQNFTAYV